MSQSAALFGRPQQPQARHLLQFKAGKMTMDNDNWVRADPRKGWAYVYQAGDGKLHFSWIDRKTCLVEDNFVILPKQAEFKKVTQCTTGRVYLLKFKGPKRFFIWMQEPNGKNDDDICTRINDYIKSPPAQTTPPSSDWLSGFSGLGQLSHSDLLALLSMGVGLGSGLSSDSDVSSAQATATTIGRHLNTGHLDTSVNPTSVVASTFPTPGATSAGASASGKRPEGGKIQLQDLRNILSSISTAAPKAPEVSIDLNDALNMDSLRTLLERPEVQARLLPHLPPTDPEAGVSSDQTNLTTNIRSSQFKSMLKSFSAAFQTGELAPVLAQFKLGAKADEAAKRGDLVAFAQALQGEASGSGTTATSDESSKKPKEDKPSDPKPEKRDDSGESAMDLD